MISTQIESQLQSLTMNFKCPSIGVSKGRAVIKCKQLTVDDLMRLVVDFKKNVDKEREDAGLDTISKSREPDPRDAEVQGLIRQSQDLMKIVEEGTLKQYFIQREDIR